MLCLHSWGGDFKNIFKRGWFHFFVLCRAEFLLDINHTETRDDFIVNCYSSNFLNIIKMQGFSQLKHIQLHTYVTACLIMSFNKSAKFITDYSCYKISVTKKNRLNSSVTRRGRMERSRPVRAIKYFVLILYNLRPCQDLCDIWAQRAWNPPCTYLTQLVRNTAFIAFKIFHIYSEHPHITS